MTQHPTTQHVPLRSFIERDVMIKAVATVLACVPDEDEAREVVEMLLAPARGVYRPSYR